MIDLLAQQKTSFLSSLNDPFASAHRLHEILRTKQPEFAFCVGGTETSDLEGISAAGAGPQERRLTPSIDADILSQGRPRSRETLPVSPTGIVSPVVISRACLNLLKATVRVVDCGTFRQPLKYDLQAGQIPAKCVSSGQALPYEHVQELVAQGFEFAECIAPGGYLIVGECVPGGTTSALAVLMGSGIPAQSLVSSSAVNDTRALKVSLVEQGLDRAAIDPRSGGADPLRLLSAIGDPMQAFAAGLSLAASQKMPVVLAGGSQMLAVYHLCHLFENTCRFSLNAENLFVITTKWLACDKFSNTSQLAKLLSAPFFAATTDLHASRFEGLRAYERGHVKEGTGAGALMAAAQARLDLSNADLVRAIDVAYEELVHAPAPAAQSA